MQDNHKPNHTCRACGKLYYACDSCDKKIDKTWRTACCTEGHYKAYYAMWQYGQGQISLEDAKAVLVEQDAMSWENAPERAFIEEIMGEPENAEVEEPQAEEPEDDHNEPEEVEEKPAVPAGKKKRRR